MEQSEDQSGLRLGKADRDEVRTVSVNPGNPRPSGRGGCQSISLWDIAAALVMRSPDRQMVHALLEWQETTGQDVMPLAMRVPLNNDNLRRALKIDIIG